METLNVLGANLCGCFVGAGASKIDLRTWKEL